MAQQTAVEWLYNQLDGFSDEEWGKIDDLFKQAKQMERNQIEKSFEEGQKIILDAFEKYSESLSNCAKAYYRENYESNTGV